MKTRISLFFGALISFTAVSSVARADWYMVGPREFKPENSTLVYGPFADGIKLSGGVADYLVAPIRLPAGSVMTSVFCQLYDAASAFDINVNFQEIQTDDNAGVISRLNLFVQFVRVNRAQEIRRHHCERLRRHQDVRQRRRGGREPVLLLRPTGAAQRLEHHRPQVLRDRLHPLE